MTYLIVGLGNPGLNYELNRHNIGFLMVDILHRTYGTQGFQKNKWNGIVAEGLINGHKVLFLKPQTYMNLSGTAVSGVANFYKIPLENILVIHDDLDIQPAEIRIKKGGSPGGHNGLKSIDANLGKDYWRLRIGIGHPGVKDMVSSYVLSNLTQKEMSLFQDIFFKIEKNFSLLFQDDQIKPDIFLNALKLE